jgi:glycosyltransferase involved in cell wall biosynthesis
MRIAYITPYQGPTLVKQRPIVKNRSMSNRIKIELVASLLRGNSHHVEVISQGEVVESRSLFHPSFSEPERFHPEIPVYYGSVIPIRRLNGWWSNARTLSIFKARHRRHPYDLVIIFNMKGPQIACANYAIQHGIPVILQYEDDTFVNVQGEKEGGLAAYRSTRAASQLMLSVSGCMAVSPHLLSQVPVGIPKLLLRGVVGADIVEASEKFRGRKEKMVMFSGTHVPSNGVGELIRAWRGLQPPDWTLHITGYGRLTDELKQLAADVPGIVFHGLVSREELVRLMGSAAICINPHQLSRTPGNVFAFKLIEYLAAGAHVITTPMGALESELEAGISYMPDNSPATIASTIRQAIEENHWERSAPAAAQQSYGPEAVARALNTLLNQVRPKAVNVA